MGLFVLATGHGVFCVYAVLSNPRGDPSSLKGLKETREHGVRSFLVVKVTSGAGEGRDPVSLGT